jgi:serine/threonine protein kinase
MSDNKRDEALELAEAVTVALDGRYIIGGIVGYGRGGIIVRARDVSGRIVALKIAWKDQEARDQVLRETEITAKIDHPSVLTPRRVDVPEPLLVVETTLMASSLGDLLDTNKPVPFETVRDILLAIGAVLDSAHSLGIVHGGILPEKIFVDDNGRYFIGDFSLRLPQAIFVEGNRPSAVGFSAYTPMEQRHDLPTADGRIDEFSLAVVAYELLRGTRRWRFGAEDVLEIDAIDMVVSRPIAVGAPPTASAAIRRATSREAAFRYPTVGEFVRSFAGLSRGATPSEHIFRTPFVEEKRRSWLWLLPIAAGIAALVAFRPLVRQQVIKFWHADWTSADFWHGNFGTSDKPSTGVATQPGTSGATSTMTHGVATERSNGTGTARTTARGDDGKTTVIGGAAKSEPNIDIFPRVQSQASAQPSGSAPRDQARNERPSATGKNPSPAPSKNSSPAPSKNTAISSAGDAVQRATNPASTAPAKPVDNRPGSVEVSVTGSDEAEVYIDGRSRGRAPLTWQGSVGKHVVSLRPASRFTPTLIEVTVTSGSTVRAVFTSR